MKSVYIFVCRVPQVSEESALQKKFAELAFGFVNHKGQRMPIKIFTTYARLLAARNQNNNDLEASVDRVKRGSFGRDKFGNF